ncbi:MAG: hypothetical protein D6798_07660, partial [Deltaproteobacteria bacterium]
RFWQRFQAGELPQDSGRTPTLFVVIDAIPLDVAQEVHAAGALPGFDPPVAQVSVFPSLTHVALSALARPAVDLRPPGYESLYVHVPSGEVRGSFLDGDSPGPWRTQADGMLGLGAIYLLRTAMARQEARWIRLRFKSEGGPWLGYIAATDGVAHFSGRDALVTAFTEVCREIVDARRAFQSAHGVDPHVVLCSDHGMEWGLHSALSFETVVQRLRLEGYEPGRQGRRGVLSAPMGDVGAGMLWCHPDAASDLAQLASELPGVELAVARSPGSTADRGSGTVFRVLPGRATRARVSWGPRGLRYECLDGDPLELAPLLDRAGTADPDGWLDDGDGFAATWDHRFPDPLHRIRHGLTDLVQYPANVIFSMASGWTVGARITQTTAGLLGGQVGTHGSLNRAQTLGFVACSGEGPAFEAMAKMPAVRAEHVFLGWQDLVRAGSAR